MNEVMRSYGLKTRGRDSKDVAIQRKDQLRAQREDVCEPRRGI